MAQLYERAWCVTARRQQSGYDNSSSCATTWLTAAHVVAGETSVRLTNDAIDIHATVAKVYLEYDLAVLTGAASVSAINWGETPRSGAEALVVGYGRGQRELINLQRDGSQAKPYQVRQVRRAILRNHL